MTGGNGSGTGPRPGPGPDPDSLETVRLPGIPAPPPGEGRDDQYSATAMDGGAWAAGGEEPTTAAQPPPTTPTLAHPAVLRFGPGVPAQTAEIWHGTVPGASSGPGGPGGVQRPRSRMRRWLRRYAPALLVLIAVVLFLYWQYGGPGVSVTGVQVSVASEPGCGETADVVGLVRTDGQPGTLTYEWIRSDGTTSGILKERVTRGQHEVEVHLLWRFEGEGRLEATAELRIAAPSEHTASVTFAYACP